MEEKGIANLNLEEKSNHERLLSFSMMFCCLHGWQFSDSPDYDRV